MEIKMSKIDIGGVLTLPSNWEGYNFNEETNSWIKGSDLYKDKKGKLYPFCSMASIGDIAKSFKTCPIDEDNILIIRGEVNDTFVVAYILVGSSDIENYEFKTKLLID